jgi:hypothetical protein
MKALLQACAITWVLALPACGGSASAEGNATAPAAPIAVPINPLPLSERN